MLEGVKYESSNANHELFVCLKLILTNNVSKINKSKISSIIQTIDNLKDIIN